MHPPDLLLHVAFCGFSHRCCGVELILDVSDYFFVFFFCIRWICLHVAFWPLFHAAAWHFREQ